MARWWYGLGLLLCAGTASATDWAATLQRQGFVLLTHDNAEPPQAVVQGATRDVFALPPDGLTFSRPTTGESTVVLPGGSLPPAPAPALGWRVSMQFAAEDPDRPKRMGFGYIPNDAVGTAHTFAPPGKPSPTANLHTRAVMPVASVRSFDLGVLPPGAKFHTGYALLDDWRMEATHGAVFRVRATVDAAPPVVLHEVTLDMAGQLATDPPWRRMDLDLGALAGKTVILHLETEDAPGVPTPNLAVPLWGDPVVYTNLRRDAAPHGILLISLDTVRADRLGCYGYPRGTSPHLDALAAESYLFENALTPAPMTTPAHASALTGVSPYLHRAGVFAEGFRLSPHWAPVSTLLTEAGYRTAAFTEGIALGGSIGFSRGFQQYSDGASPLSHDRDLIRMTFRDARSWLDQFGHLPSLLFVHTYHAHDPYTAPDAILNRFTDPAYTGRAMVHAKDAKTPEERQNASDCYDAGLAYTDEQFGAFVQGLRDAGLLENRWLIVFSDHGEEFWEHGGVAHARALYRESVHVPLIVRPPGGLATGQRVSTPVLITDIFATAMAIAGVPMPTDRDSVDLVALARAAQGGREALGGFFRGYEFPKFGQTESKEWETFSLRTPAFTYITTAPKVGQPPTEELFAPEDIKERDNLAPQRPDLLEAARKALEALRARDDAQRPAPGAKPNRGLNETEVDALQGLGYF